MTSVRRTRRRIGRSPVETRMAEVAELDTAPDTIEATVNYLKDTGEMPWTYSGGEGSTEVKSSSTPDPRRVSIRNGRPHAGGFVLERAGFRSVRQATARRDFLAADEAKRVYYPGLGPRIKAET